MNPIILDGKRTASLLEDELKEKTNLFKKRYFRYPKLVVILVGNNFSSEKYVAAKEKACDRVNIETTTLKFSDISEKELIEEIYKLNLDQTVDGILVQLPLPENISKAKVIRAISPIKDVDCFTSGNLGRFYQQRNCISPCTPLGVMTLLDWYNIKLSGKSAVVIGRSTLVGRPVAEFLTQRDATVTLCHSKTKNLSDYTKNADIIISAAGKRDLITPDMIKDGVVIVDVSTNRGENGKLCGDVNHDCYEKCYAYSPVPGGVGPMTISSLLKNTCELAFNRAERDSEGRREYLKNLANELKEYKEKNKISATALSKEIGLSRKFLSDFEAGLARLSDHSEKLIKEFLSERSTDDTRD